MVLKMVDLYQNRQGYNLRCFWLEYDRNDEDLSFENKKKNIFYAKLETSFIKESETIGSGYMSDTNSITISTLDNVSRLMNEFNKSVKCLVYVCRLKKYFIVEDVQTKIEQMNADIVSYKRLRSRTYLRLVEYEN